MTGARAGGGAGVGDGKRVDCCIGGLRGGGGYGGSRSVV